MHTNQRSTLLVEGAVLVVLRIMLLLGCREFLFRSLYTDLQALSSESAGPVMAENVSAAAPTTGGRSVLDENQQQVFELQELPNPVTVNTMHVFKSSSFPGLRSSVARTVFAVVFVESCMMFFVLMLQGLEQFAPPVRLFSWKFSLISLLGIILLVVPLSTSLLLASRPHSTRTHRLRRPRFLIFRVSFSFLLVGLYLFLLSRVPLPPALKSADTFTAVLARLIVLGTLILGLLSGFGAVSNAWGYLPLVSRSRSVPTEQEITTAEHSLQSVRNDLRERRELKERRVNASPAKSTWISRVVPNLRGDGGSSEIRGLEMLENEMTRNLESLRSRRDEAKYAQTIYGRFVCVMGRVFAVYCVVRIGSSIFNLLFPGRYVVSSLDVAGTGTTQSRTKTTDFVADVLARLLTLAFERTGTMTVSQRAEIAASIARQLSLGLVGVIILTSVRRVLIGVTRALRITSKNTGASLMMLFLAQLMGIYLLSTIVQLRNLFPPLPVNSGPRLDIDPAETGQSGSYRTDDYNVFMTVPAFGVFGSLFDWSFLAAAAGSVVVRWGMEKFSSGGSL